MEGSVDNQDHSPVGPGGREERTDLVLVYPPWPVLQERTILQNSLPPLGILSIASCVESKGFRTEVLDLHGERIEEDDFRNRIRQSQPRFVGISILTNMCIPAHKIARICKEEVPDVMVIAGGVHAEALPERTLRNSAIDVVIRGDGEDAMLEIMEGRPLSEINGASYRTGQGVQHNPPRSIEMALDRFPLPAYHMVDFDNYFPAVASYRNLPAINMLMTRGCPGRCTFCNSARTVLRARSPESVVRQIKHLHDHYGIRQIQFYDDTFTVLKSKCLEFCRLLAAENLDLGWTAYIRGDCFSEDLAAAMKEAGCHQVLMGIETGSPEISRRIGKPIDRNRYIKAVHIAHDHGMEVRGSFIIGNMGETLATMQETLDFAIELDIDLFQLSISTPYPGTALFAEAMEAGTLVSTDWYSFGQGEVLVNQPQITDEDIYAFERQAFRKFYGRPLTVLRLLKRVTRWRHVRDYGLAALLLVIGWRPKKDHDMACWCGLAEADFLDLFLDEPDAVRLTYELREGKGEAVD